MNKSAISSKLLTSEDYWAIWIGSFFLIFGILIYLHIGKNEIGDAIVANSNKLATLKNDQKSIESLKAKDQLTRLSGAGIAYGKQIKKVLSRPKKWQGNPVDAFYAPANTPSDKELVAIQSLQADLSFLEFSEKTGIKSGDLANQWKGKKSELDALQKKAFNNGYFILPDLLKLATIIGLIFGIGAWFMGKDYLQFFLAFMAVFVLAVLSFFLASQADMKDLGLGYAIWAILIGMIISNTLGTPSWIRPAVMTEYYIKTGLVLLGASILLNKIMAIGLPGIFVAWIVTPIVLVITFWFGQKVLKIGSKTLNITISADMSVCGVSAAIATAAACNAKKEELTLAVGLSMVFTSVMMIVMPAFIKFIGLPEILGGAWIGGTIDATGAVVAAGAFLGDKALSVAATIKMIQNIMIGVIAFGVAVFWSTRVENTGKTSVGISEIWKRFPKFILGFFGASIVFSIIFRMMEPSLASALIDNGLVGGFTNDLIEWLFCLAFVSIGLSVNFRELRHQFSGGKPLLLYLCGQSFNLILTLLMAYIMFYLVFPQITEMI